MPRTSPNAGHAQHRSRFWTRLSDAAERKRVRCFICGRDHLGTAEQRVCDRDSCQRKYIWRSHKYGGPRENGGCRVSMSHADLVQRLAEIISENE